jgi:hypothetical protein
VTDTAWKSANAPATGWEQPAFEDSAWPTAQMGAKYGSGPLPRIDAAAVVTESAPPDPSVPSMTTDHRAGTATGPPPDLP